MEAEQGKAGWLKGWGRVWLGWLGKLDSEGELEEETTRELKEELVGMGRRETRLLVKCLPDYL